MASGVINLATVKALSLFASSSPERPSMNGVLIEAEDGFLTYVATDGDHLMAVREDLRTESSLSGEYIIPPKHIRNPKLKGYDDGLLEDLSGCPHLTISVDNGGELLDVSFLRVEQQFPEWRRIMPQGATGKLAQYSPKFLNNFGRAAHALDLGHPFVAYNGDAPASIWFAKTKNAVGIIHPLTTLDLMHRQAPQWAVFSDIRRTQLDIETMVLETDPLQPVEAQQEASP